MTSDHTIVLLASGTLSIMAIAHAAPAACQEDPRGSAAGELVAHAEILFQPRYDPPDERLLPRPDSLVLLLTLRAGGAGILAIENRYWPGAGAMAAVAWTRRGDRVELAPGSIGDDDSQWTWDPLVLELADSDGDGILDSGTGSMRGHYQQMQGDVMDGAQVDARLLAREDATPPLAAIRGTSAPGVRLPVSDRVEVGFSEPVPWESARYVRVLAAGEPLAGDLAPLREVHGHAVAAVLRLEDFLPFDAAMVLDPEAARDAAGNAVIWNGDTLRTPADPGSFANHLRLEPGLEGWIAEGRVADTARFQNLEPSARGRLAVVQSGGRMTGYLDVPADATSLDFSVTVFSEIGEFDAGRNAVISLLVPGRETTVLDASAAAGSGGACEGCEDYGHRIGPVPLSIDLVPHRGHRLSVTIGAGSSGYLGMNEYAIVLDDLRLR